MCKSDIFVPFTGVSESPFGKPSKLAGLEVGASVNKIINVILIK